MSTYEKDTTVHPERTRCPVHFRFPDYHLFVDYRLCAEDNRPRHRQRPLYLGGAGTYRPEPGLDAGAVDSHVGTGGVTDGIRTAKFRF